MQYFIGEGMEEPIVPDTAMLILLQIFWQVHTIVWGAEFCCTAAAATIELRSSDRTSFRHYQIRLTNWLFCSKSQSFGFNSNMIYFAALYVFSVSLPPILYSYFKGGLPCSDLCQSSQ